MQKRFNADRELIAGILRQPTAKRVIAAFATVVQQSAAQVTQDMAGFARGVDTVRVVRSVRHNSHKPCDDTCIMLVRPPTRRSGVISS